MKNAAIFLGALVLGVLLIALLNFINQPKNPTLLAPQPTTSPEPNFSLSVAPTSALKGQILSLSGNVSWQSRTATSPAILKTPITIQQGERLVTKDTGTAKVSFKDTLTLTLSPKTDLSFTQTLPVNPVFTQNEGRVDYLKQSGKNPFSVRALSLLIDQSSPGELVVEVDKDSSQVSVLLLKGQVTVGYNDPQYLSHVQTIEAGQEFDFDADAQEGSLR